MKTTKNILNTNTTNTNTTDTTNTTRKANAKNGYIKTLKNSNMINYFAYNKNKELKQKTIDFINTIWDEKTNTQQQTQTRVIKISNENATHFKNEILIDFASTLFYNKLKNIDFTNLNIKKIISTALLNNFKTTTTKIDRKKEWTIDNTTFDTTTSNYKFLCDVCHRLAVYIDTQNKLAK